MSVSGNDLPPAGEGLGESLPVGEGGSPAPVDSGEGSGSVSGAVQSVLYVYPGVDYDAMYDAVYGASYDAIETYAQSVTDGQAVNSAALSYFQGVLNNQFLPVDYVIYVGNSYVYSGSTRYEYCMAYGDLELSGTRFTGTGTVVTMRVSGYNSVSYAHGQAIDVNAPMYYSRSNLGDYSGVVSYDWHGLFVLLFLMIGGLSWLIRKLMRLSY